MKYLILQKNNWSNLLLLTSLIKNLGIKNQIDLYTDEDGKNIFKYSKLCNFIELSNIKSNYDIVLNYSYTLDCLDLMDSLRVEEKFGFGHRNFGIGSELWNKFIIEKEQKTNSCDFQLFYGIANLKWKGEGYNLRYYPKFKSSQIAIGYFFNNEQLVKLVKKHIKYSPLIKIPKLDKICDQIDEINPCKQIVTDDINIARIGIALRKYVYYVLEKSLSYRLQFFGCGKEVVLNY